MQVKVCCVGKLKDSFYQEGCAEYLRRLSRFFRVSVLEVPDERIPDRASPLQEDAVREKEGARLLERIDPSDYVIALCIDGIRMTSETFAERIRSLSDAGRSSIAFVIGGSIGLNASVLRRADLKLSVSEMTLPHRLCRLFLLEQLYRACKINAGEPYHK